MSKPNHAGSTPAGPTNPVIGEAAAGGPGSGTDTQASSDWLGELVHGADPAAQRTAGVPVDTGQRNGHRAGDAVESKRGQQ